MSWSGIETWAEYVPERAPGTGVYQSFQGEITVGGNILARIENASIRVSNNLGRFTECGKTSPVVYAGPISVDGRINGALVDLAMYRLLRGYAIGAITGLEPNYQTYLDSDVKLIVEQDLGSFPLLKGKGADEFSHLSTNFYTHPVNISMVVNKDKLDQQVFGELASGEYVHKVNAIGALLNGGTISVRNGTAYIVSNIDFIAKNAEWTIEGNTPR